MYDTSSDAVDRGICGQYGGGACRYSATLAGNLPERSVWEEFRDASTIFSTTRHHLHQCDGSSSPAWTNRLMMQYQAHEQQSQDQQNHRRRNRNNNTNTTQDAGRPVVPISS
jgi:hypothetical protein